MIFDDNDVHSLALCAWKEARGNGISGCVYVMHSVVNRVDTPGFPKTIHDVIYQKNAFTSMSVPSDPEFNLEPKSNDPVWLACLADAPEVLKGADDPTLGAVYYSNEENVTSGWYKRNIIDSGLHPITVKYGQHTFRK